MKTKLFITGFALVAITGWTAAQETTSRSTPQNAPDNAPAYVDDNKNGVCDNYENRTSVANNSNTKVCGQGRGTGQRHGKNKGNGCGRGNGDGTGRNFIDENKNGVCDRYESTTSK